MTETEVKRALNLVRYGGIVTTVIVFVALLAFSLVIGNALSQVDPSATGLTFSALLPYTIGFTVLAAVLSIILFFAYRAYLMGRMTKTS
jgi:hypothetical protein